MQSRFAMGPRACLLLVPMAAAMLIAGCTSMGAQRVGIDRSDYTQRLRESEKEQLLMNIVALRHGDPPLFLNVTSVISQYTREASANAGVNVDPAIDSDAGFVAGGVLLRETPTITYTPLAGESFSRNMLAPLSPASLLGMIEAGWAADQLFRLSARSINGVSNVSRSALFAHSADADFERVIAAIRRLQYSQALSIRIMQKEKLFSAVARVRPELRPGEREDLEYVAQRLGMRQRGQELRIVFSAYPHDSDELAIATRSMFEVLMELSGCVEQGEANPAPLQPAELMRIRNGGQRPADTFAAVNYRGRWYWIERDDEVSKQTFMLAQIMMSLTDTGGGAHAPVVTIPAG